MKRGFPLVIGGVLLGLFSCSRQAADGLILSHNLGARSLLRIEITPSDITLPSGVTYQYHLTAVLADQTTEDITSLADWQLADPQIAGFNATLGEIETFAQGTISVWANYSGLTATAKITVNAASLQSIQVTPANLTLPNGLTQQFIATGLYSDNSVVDLTSSATWTSSDTSVVTISNAAGTQGIASTQNIGNATITATLGGVFGTTTFTVSAVTLLSMEITPSGTTIASGTNQQLNATGTYSDNSTQDLTSASAWSSSDTNIATVSSSGVLTTHSVGSVTITATLGGVMTTADFTVSSATLSSISVTPTNSSVTNGTTRQFTATGTYSDNSTQDLTSSVLWSSSDMSVVTISNVSGSQGVASTHNVGSATITARLGAISGSTTFTVSSASLASIAITPANATIASGSVQQFTAIGTYSDNTTQDLTSSVLWASSNTGVASVSNASGSKGVVTTVSVGGVNITATLSGVLGTTSLTVSAATLTSIAITPSNASIALGTHLTMTATGTFSDLSTADITNQVTWGSTNSLIATISNAAGTKGVVTTVAAGAITVSASLGGVSNTTSLTITSATLVSIAVTPSNSLVAKGLTLQLTATGTYSDSSTQNLTSAVTWTSTNSLVASISNAGGSKGTVTAVNVGAVTITAALSSISGNTGFTVSAPQLVSIAVTPASQTIPLGLTQAYTATGTYTDLSTANLTTSVSWSVASGLIASINGTGVLSTIAQGPTAVIATLGSVSGQTPVTVSAPILISIVVTPTNPSVMITQNTQFTATGNYSNSSTANLTTSVTWASSATLKATVSNSAGTNGRATCVTLGAATISATLTSIVGQTTINCIL